MRRPARSTAGALLAWGLLTGVLVAGCGDREFEPPDREARVEAAAADFTMAVFDTVTWADPDERAFRGNVVYATHCRSCHGSVGEAGTDYARERGLEVPSLVRKDWRLAGARDSVLHRIFVGHAAGMPTWGVAGLTPREMDAVTHYLLEVLRPEVLEGGDAG